MWNESVFELPGAPMMPRGILVTKHTTLQRETTKVNHQDRSTWFLEQRISTVGAHIANMFSFRAWFKAMPPPMSKLARLTKADSSAATKS